MSSILEEGINFDNLPITTDVIISHYENKLNERIADKTVKASKAGVAPVFTQEEWLYLNKKSTPANPDAEITVITPAPTITLKKGNTEINVKNAWALVQKMQEMYPNGMSEDSREDFFRQPFIEKSIEEGLKNEENNLFVENEHAPVMREKFKTMVNFDVKKVSQEVAKSVAPDVETFQKSQFKKSPEIEKSVNKNAYEIRADVLNMALDWVKYNHIRTENGPCLNDDLVIDIAKKFYSFVENRR